MWPSFPAKLRYCIIFGTTRNPVKIQQKFISCDSWYSSPTKKPLVQDTTAVILGWAASQQNHVQKYTQLYSSEIGIGAHGFTLPMDITFTYDHKKCDNIAQILLEKVTKENTGKQLVLHFFSDNGMLLYKHLTRKLNNHPDGLKLAGCVIDSAPTPLTIWPYITSKNFSLFYRDTPLVFPWIKLPFVFGYFLRTELKLPITNCIIATITITPRSIYNYLKFGRNDWGGLYLKNIENENWPILFFYSYKDNLATHKYIAHIIDVKKNQNPSRLIMAKKFHDSGHVTHLRKYPEEYTTELESFLLQCKNEIDKP